MSPDAGTDPWRRDVATFVLAQIPAPPGRVLDVGCGDGWLSRELAADGYAVRGVDPEAPDEQLFARVGFEDFDEPGPFDAVVAVLSLHHIPDLSAAVDRMASLLQPEGVLVVSEFSWDRFDDDTARWCLDRLPPELDDHNWLQRRGAELRERLALGQPLQAPDCFGRWAAEEGFHGTEEMLTQLRSRFSEQLFSPGPYLYPGLDGVTEEIERAAIDAGQIRPIGFRFVATSRASHRR